MKALTLKAPSGLPMTIKFTVPGDPVPKARARTFWDGKIGQFRSATPKRTKSFEKLVKGYAVEAKNKAGVRGLSTIPIKIQITAYLAIPKDFKATDASWAEQGLILPTKKSNINPDWDNLGKAISDALNGVVYVDDAQVVDAHVRKFYSKTPRVEVEINDH